MRLIEAIIDANHRAVAGDKEAGLHPDDFANELPVVALTCIDPRLNAYFPNALGLPAEKFIWLRNAGNIITGPLSSTMRSLALACAVKEGREIAIIGHSDCQIAKTTAMRLLERLKELGVDRHSLPDNLNEFFGMFGSERANVIKACEIVRHSPLIGAQIPVHGLLLDTETGKLEWIVNGYEAMKAQPAVLGELGKGSPLSSLKNFEMGEMKFPQMKIGELAAKAENLVAHEIGQAAARAEAIPVAESVESEMKRAADYAAITVPPKIPVPPPIHPRFYSRKR